MEKQLAQTDPVIANTVDVWLQPFREQDTKNLRSDCIQSTEDYLINYLKGEKLKGKEKVHLAMTGSVPSLVLMDVIKNTFLSHRAWPENMQTITYFKENKLVLRNGTGEEKILYPLQEEPTT